MHIGHDGFGIALDLRIRHGKESEGAVPEGGCRAQGHQSVHVRRPVPQAFIAADKESLVDDHDRNRQQEL